MKLKNVLITGASGGLASQLVDKIEAENIILLSRNIEPLVEKYEANSAIHLYECDITDNEQVKIICQNISKRFGALDLLINNAGFGEFKNFINFSYEEIVAMFDVNVLGLMNITKQFLPGMIEQKSGQIINIASMAGKMATAQSSIYSATKYAVVGFSDALRLELKDSNIFVTTVNPGPIKTDFFVKADPSGEYLKKVDFIVLSPDKVAQKIVNVIGKNKREVNLPLAMTFAAKSYQLFPRIGDMLAGGLFNLK
ncbi:SDR family NAD(P)-dependent oxidoreductase [Floricoccus penangensis]|uniref:SDR family NAD(P)-dependent oxidoreductase n=1 Tax=Floricoccus penangensis TaxID=1859475 RepID=UPI002041DEE7|nr:SDR family oxidoreductase [Floricoccus penangensis]URZ86789.1 SDR family oxidoreductase [Floricoccus penangensis]